MPQSPHRVTPADFDDAPELADRFMANQPVIVNLQGVDAKVARRLIDFASGLCYGKEGQMERITSQVYLLTPSGLEFDPPTDPDRSPLNLGGPSPGGSAAAALPVDDWVFTGAVSTVEVR